MAEAFDSNTGRSLECWLELTDEDGRDGQLTRLFRSPAQNKFMAREENQQHPWRIRLAEFLVTPHQQMRQDRAERLRAQTIEEPAVQTALERIDAAYRMLDTTITCITITQSKDEEVLQVFKRLNRGGTGLKARDVIAADLGIGKSVEILQKLQSFVEQKTPTALGFGFSFAFRALVVFHLGNAQLKHLSRKWADEGEKGDRGQSLRESWGEAQRGLERALAFADTMGWSRRPLLPSCNALIPLAVALHRLDREPDASEREILTRWFCLTALRGVYTGSVETTLNKHLRAIKENARKPINGLLAGLTKNESRPIHPDEFRKPARLWGSFSQVMFAWLVTHKAKDWMTGQLLDSIARLGVESAHPEETLSIQHIFPRQLLAEQGYDPEEANYPANFAVIAKSPNCSLQDLPPKDALLRLDTHEKRERARLQRFSDEAGDLLAPNRYTDFLEWRAKRLAEAWNEWLELKP